ncbi:MAG TPA: glycerophosphodiester phosphodiesterase [Candidatus Faecaligallichristensenella faecipullorum]|nr:glycerophosphodiester phosphodiesterase [Candidatus Faecaligallichristensenella faecipullorum]
MLRRKPGRPLFSQIRETARLLGGCWRALALFELVYQFAAGYLVLPLCKWLFSRSLVLSGMYYVTEQNLWTLYRHPLVILAILAIVYLIALFMALEAVCIIIVLNQSGQKSNLGVIQLLGEGMRAMLRLILPGGAALVGLSALLIPLSNLIVSSSFLRNIQLYQFLNEALLSHFPANLAYMAATLGLIALVSKWMYAFHFFSLERMDGRPAIQASRRLSAGRRIGGVAGYILVSSAAALLLWALSSAALYLLNQAALSLFSGELLERVQSLLGRSVSTIFSFIRQGAAVAIGYAYLTTAYYRGKWHARAPIPAPIAPRSPRAKRLNAMIFTPVALVLVTALVIMDWTGWESPASIKLSELNLAEPLPSQRLMVMAHRGSSVQAPENTMSAFELAIQQRADYIELDVQESKDGVVVVVHDSNFRRTAGVNRPVGAMDYEDILRLDVGARFSRRFEGEKVPSLAQVMRACKGKVKLNIELKSTPYQKNLVESVVNLIERYEFQEDCVIQSVNYAYLQQVKDLNPDIRCGYIMAAVLGSYENLPCADFFTIEKSFVNAAAIQKAHNLGKHMYVWTVDTRAAMEQMIDLGVDGIITNRPDLAREVLLERDTQQLEFLSSLEDGPLAGLLPEEEEETPPELQPTPDPDTRPTSILDGA